MNLKKRYILFISILLVITSCNTIEEQQGTLTINTLGNPPLSAVYTIPHINQHAITVKVHGKTEAMDIAYTYPANYGTEFPIHGLYQDYNNTITIIENGVTKQYKEFVPALKESVDTTVHIKDSTATDPFNHDLYFVYSFKGTFAFDNEGDIRYYLPNIQNHANKLIYRNNELLLYDSGSIRDLLGNKKLNFDIGHDIIPYQNIHLATLNAEKDTVAEIDPSGQSINLKSIGDLFRDVVNPADKSLLDQIVYDKNNIYTNSSGEEELPTAGWGGLNALVYDHDTDILYLSLRHQGVIAVDYSEWSLIWWMTDDTLDTQRPTVPAIKNFTDVPSLQPYRVKGAGINDGPKNQHALLLRKNGNLAMFDNQGDSDMSSTGSRFIEYRITGTHGSYTATKVSEYRDPNSYSRFRSDIDLLRDNHLLISYSCINKLKVVNMNNNSVIFEMSYPGLTAFRSDKMPLYPYNDDRKYPIEFNEKIGL